MSPLRTVDVEDRPHLGYLRALAQRRQQRRMAHRLSVGQALALGLRLIGWSAVTLLTTAGLFVLLFWAIGDLTAGGFFAQIGMIGTHYGQAPADMQSRFLSHLEIIGLIALAFVSLLRSGTLFAIFEKDA